MDGVKPHTAELGDNCSLQADFKFTVHNLGHVIWSTCNNTLPVPLGIFFNLNISNFIATCMLSPKHFFYKKAHFYSVADQIEVSVLSKAQVLPQTVHLTF